MPRIPARGRALLGDALGAARAQVESRLHAYRADGLLGAETHHVLADEISHALAPPRGGTRRSQTLRAAQLAALNAEADALATLFDTRAIDQYTFLELRDILLHDREQPPGGAGESGEEVSNLFTRLEAAVLRGLRDRNWASALLARYQDVRLQQLLERNLAGVIMARAAGAALQARPDAAVQQPRISPLATVSVRCDDASGWPGSGAIFPRCTGASRRRRSHARRRCGVPARARR